jgi:hypothetical protein
VFVSDNAEAKLHEALEDILDDPRNAEVIQVGEQFVETIGGATTEEWEAAARAEGALDDEDEPEVCSGCLGALAPDDGDQDDDYCANCRAKGYTGCAPPPMEGNTGNRFVGTIDVDGRKIEVRELSSDGSVDGYDIYDANDEGGEALNLGGSFDELPSVKVVRIYLAELGKQDQVAAEPAEGTVPCKFCAKDVSAKTAHLHQGQWIGDECCWDDRLKASE